LQRRIFKIAEENVKISLTRCLGKKEFLTTFYIIIQKIFEG